MKRDSSRNNSWKRFLGDLSLVASTYLAHFIVWRTLRTNRKSAGEAKNLLLNDRKPVVLSGE